MEKQRISEDHRSYVNFKKKLLKQGHYIRKIPCAQKREKNSVINENIAGIVIECYPYFALVQLPFCKKCFFYDEIHVISKKDYHQIVRSKKGSKNWVKGDD